MMVYQSFVYLQNENTGSAFVEEFLRNFCRQPLMEYEKHGTLPFSPGKFCFINVRHPLLQYLSLFASGLDGKGELFERLQAAGKSDLYERSEEGFERWIAFVCDPENAAMLDERYTPDVAQLVGFMSWRFFRLACPGFEEAAPGWTNKEQLQDYVRARNVINEVVRTEHLREDLKGLVIGPLHPVIAKQSEALAWIDNTEKINSSGSDPSGFKVSSQAANTVMSKEAPIASSFYRTPLTSIAISGEDG